LRACIANTLVGCLVGLAHRYRRHQITQPLAAAMVLLSSHAVQQTVAMLPNSAAFIIAAGTKHESRSMAPQQAPAAW
jgi:hypothetical protein